MTEEEWLTESDPKAMLDYLRGKVGERKLRLFMTACVRRLGHLLVVSIAREALETAELYADGHLQGTEQQLASDEPWLDNRLYALERGCTLAAKGLSNAEWPRDWRDSEMAAYYATVAAGDCNRTSLMPDQWTGQANWISEASSDAVNYASGNRNSDVAKVSERHAHAWLLFDIFGNPFRPIVADPAWLSPTVQSIASAIYQDRAFDRLPILADALEEAGCTNADVLLHCRQPGEHVRGCWVVDLVLGKT